MERDGVWRKEVNDLVKVWSTRAQPEDNSWGHRPCLKYEVSVMVRFQSPSPQILLPKSSFCGQKMGATERTG